MDSLVTLLCGGTAIHPVDSQPETILETIQIYRPDYISVAPKPLIDILRMLEARPMRLPKAKSLRSAGAYFSPHVQETALEHISEEVVSSYGSAETSWTAWGTSEEIRKIPGSVGRIPMGIEVATFDSMGEQLPVGAEGAIRVKCTEDLAPIYLDDQAGAQSNFKDGWFSTGDTGFVDENRHLIFRGRANNIINLGGNKINPEILEEQLLTFSGIVDVGVVGVDDPDGFQQVCAAIVSTSKQTVDEINQQFHQRRQRHAVQLVMNVEAIPKTENGKIDRTALKRLCAE